MNICYNHDIVGICRRVNRFIDELCKSASSGVSLVNVFDQDRMSSYLSAIMSYYAWVVGQPQLDLPETNPREYILEPNPEIPEIENESIADMINLFVLCRDELMGSQSARMGAGLIAHDSRRFVAMVDKCTALLEDYIKVATPLDFPESSPQEVLAGPGLTGV